MESLRVKFWGTRGIVPSPRFKTSIFGGNTNCVEILTGGNEIIVVDTGHGAAILGETLQKRIVEKKENLDIHIFFTHFHWDHVLGLPFFHPIYYENTNIHLYAPYSHKEMLKNLDVLFDGSYSPFSGIESMPSRITFHHLIKPIHVGDLKVSFTEVNHHIEGIEGLHLPTFAYRFDLHSNSAVVATDHEADKDHQLNERLVKFAAFTNILVHDGQFTDEDFIPGWGHSTVTQAMENGKLIKPGIIILSHHHPHRDDEDILALEKAYRAKEEYKGLNFAFAKEGDVFDSADFNSTDKK